MYFKKYTQQLEVIDYIQWGQDHLYLDDPTITKLANMPIESNFFEIEAIFDKIRVFHQFKEPTALESAQHRLKKLHANLLLPNRNAIQLVQEIYSLCIEFEMQEEQLIWLELSDVIDDMQHGDHPRYTTESEVSNYIRIRARELWHTKKSTYPVENLLHQKVTAVDTESGILIYLNQGAITIECPWRLRSTEQILLGETDITFNQKPKQSLAELLIGKTILDIQLYENCPFLIIQMDDVFLDLFHASSFFDGWTLTGEDDFYLFSIHGGHLG